MPGDPSTQMEIINDFRKGIHEYIGSTYDPGVAQKDRTFRCFGQDNGSLAPLPGLNKKIYMDWNTDGTNALPIEPSQNLYTEFRITGIKVSPPVFYPPDQTIGDDQNNSEIWVCYEYAWVDGGNTKLSNRISRYMRMREAFPGWEVIWDNSTVTGPAGSFDSTHPIRPTPCDFYYQRTNHTTPTSVGNIAIMWSVGNQAHYFPNEDDNNSVANLPGNANAFFAPAHLVAHQGRAVLFPLFFSPNGSNGHDFFVNTESFYWTEVNDLRTLDAELSGNFLNNIVFYEYPTGYGVMESLSADHLLLIKAHGGAVMLQGSMDDYRADTLSNVRPTGLSQNRGTRSPLGFIYPAENSGLWLWNGSDVSFNLTPQMAPNFWRPDPVTPAFGDQEPADWGYSMTTCDTADRFVFFPNNYVLDIDSKALWRLEDPDEVQFHQVSSDYRGQFVYCAPSGIRNQRDPALWEYSVVSPATSYSWQSHPMFKSIDHYMHVESVGMVAVGEGTVKITVRSFDEPDGKSQTFVIESTRYPQFHVSRMGVSGTHITFQVECFGVQDSDGNFIGPAPQFNELRYEWRESTRSRMGR